MTVRSRDRRTRRHHLLTRLPHLLLMLLLASTAGADTRTCFEDQTGLPLRDVYVTHFWTDYQTDARGCLTIPADPGWGFDYVEVDVHRQNSVVRVDDAWGLPPLIPAKARMRDGATVRVDLSHGSGRDEHMAIAESMRNAYDQGLREFSPWRSRFPAGRSRGAGDILRVVFPSNFAVAAAFTEPSGLTNNFPAVHLMAGDGDADDHWIHAHEVAHALHFSALGGATRTAIEIEFLGFLLGPEPGHDFAVRTIPMVAFVEAFAWFGDLYEATFDDAPAASGWARHRFFWEEIDRRLANGSLDGSVRGQDVEGAVFLALFHEFARDPDVGLDRVVADIVDCGSTTVDQFAACIRAEYGSSSRVYEALHAAGARYGMSFPAYTRGIVSTARTGDHFGEALATGDFDGDGFEDLAIGVPGEEISGKPGAGLVHVLYGSHFGTMKADAEHFHSDVTGIPDAHSSDGRAVEDEHFGAALAAADFDGDGLDDLAIGVPGQMVNGQADAGYVVVLYGTRTGLSTERAQRWHQDMAGIGDVAEVGDRFGSALAAGDFDGNGRDDLAIGVAGEDLTSDAAISWTDPRFTVDDLLASSTHRTIVFDAGLVHVLLGTDAGLTSADSEVWTQDSTGVADEAEIGDRFGAALAAGSVDGGPADLAIGAPGEDTNGVVSSGVVHVLRGVSGSGLSTTRSQLWDQNSPGVWSSNESGDGFGAALAWGDFDGDGRGDLAIGIPDEDLGSVVDAGAVVVLYGGINGLGGSDAVAAQGWTQNSPGVPNYGEAGDRFGASLAVGNFNGFETPTGRSIDDLAIGVPGEDILSGVDAGTVLVLYGVREDGLRSQGSVGFSQDSAGIASVPENGDAFAASLASGDFDGDGRDDLVVGAPHEGLDVPDAGAVHVIPGRSSGFRTADEAFWHQNR